MNALSAVRSYVLRHWRGELSLPVSFWLNRALASAALVAATWPFLWLLARAEVETLFGWYYAWGALAAAAVDVWFWTGVWRSAQARLAAGEDSWADAAKAVTALGVAGAVAGFVFFEYSGIKEGFAYAEVVHELEGEVRVLPGGKGLELAGALGFGFARRVTEALELNPGVRVVYTNLYRGGLVGEADALAAELKRRHLRTVVSGGCVSACTTAFLGGERRAVLYGARLGFHRPSMPGPSDGLFGFLLRSRAVDGLVARGVDAAFAEKAMSAEPGTMWHPEPDEMVRARFADEVLYEDDGAPPGAPLASDRAKTEAGLATMRVYRALKKREPETYAEILDLIVMEVSSGGTGRVASPLIVAAYSRAQPFASDAVASRSAALFADQLRAVRGKSVENCAAVADGRAADLPAGFWERSLNEELKAREQDLIAETLETAGKSGSRLGGEKTLARARANAAFRVKLNDPAPGERSPKAEAFRACESRILLYEELATLPPAEGAPAIRILAGRAAPSAKR